MNALSPRSVLVLMALAGVAAVVGAWVSQHHHGMQPCPWCVLQRLIFLVMSALALLAAVQPSGAVRRAVAVPLLLLAGAGVASALWQHLVAAKTASCAFTLADRVVGFTGLDVRFPEVFEVRANCADAAVNLLGVPYALWSLALFVLLGLASLAVLTGRRPGHRA